MHLNTIARRVSCLKLSSTSWKSAVKNGIYLPAICILKTNSNKVFTKTTSRCYSTSTLQSIDEPPSSITKFNPENDYTLRTCTCGELRKEHVGSTVTLSGWVEFQRLNKFIVLRDGYGQTQLIVDGKATDILKTIESLPYESIIQVEGRVIERPAEMVNKKQATGGIEVAVNSLKVLNKAKTNLPFNIRGFQKAKEALRLQYRYLDMRFPEMQRNLRVRSDILMDMRYFLCKKANFVDVETPTLFKATPGGAQEFIVPTRFPGLFYSLVQSPQQFKQMLMAGAVDRYFQIARCYRDETARPDRQPEFTQLDIEMSFTTAEGVQQLVEDLLVFSWPKFLPQIPERFPRMKYKDAMERYGSDKPDTRFEYHLKKCTDFFSNSLSSDNFPKGDAGAYSLVFGEHLNALTSSKKELLTILSKKYKLKFIQMKVPSKSVWLEKMSNLLGSESASALWDHLHLKENCILFLSYGKKNEVQNFMGKVRTEYVNFLEEKGEKIRSKTMNLFWLVDFPLFEEGDTPGVLCSAHHPFTAPHPEDLHLLQTNPLEVRSQSYDLVLNGEEIAGGSIRIHDPVQQENMLKLLGIDKSTMQHMLDMLGSGCPPHGGIALGLDRLMALFLDTRSIRDVIAFPKTMEGKDPLSGSPSAVTEEDKKLYHIRTIT